LGINIFNLVIFRIDITNIWFNVVDLDIWPWPLLYKTIKLTAYVPTLRQRWEGSTPRSFLSGPYDFLLRAGCVLSCMGSVRWAFYSLRDRTAPFTGLGLVGVYSRRNQTAPKTAFKLEPVDPNWYTHRTSLIYPYQPNFLAYGRNGQYNLHLYLYIYNLIIDFEHLYKFVCIHISIW
jgi:hypothetical protein